LPGERFKSPFFPFFNNFSLRKINSVQLNVAVKYYF